MKPYIKYDIFGYTRLSKGNYQRSLSNNSRRGDLEETTNSAWVRVKTYYFLAN